MQRELVTQQWIKHTDQYCVKAPLVPIVFLGNVMSFHNV